jgi:segregation and condensation protein B
MNDLARTVEALLFLSAQPVSAAELAEATETKEGQVMEAVELLREDLAEGRRGIVLREVAGGFTLASVSACAWVSGGVRGLASRRRPAACSPRPGLRR